MLGGTAAEPVSARHVFWVALALSVAGPEPRLDGSVAEQGAKVDARGDVGDTCLTQTAAVPCLFDVARHSSEDFSCNA